MPIVERAEFPHFALEVTVGPHDRVEIEASGKFFCLECNKRGDELDMIALECQMDNSFSFVRAVFLGICP